LDVYCATHHFNDFAMVRAYLLHGFHIGCGRVLASAAVNEPPNHRAMKINEVSKKISRVASKEQ
jgi:hypothetical protein